MSAPDTEVREQEPYREEPTRVRPPSLGSWVSLALATACGFLLGALVITTVGGADTTTTQTQVRTVTAPAGRANAPPTGSTVITKTLIPALVGEGLDVARTRAERARFGLVIDSGGGIFGVQVDENWEVVAQRPTADELIEQGSTIHVDIERR